MDLVQRIKEHCVDSVALSVMTPLYAGIERIAGTSVETSANARLLGVALTFGGLGFLYAKGRDSYNRFVGVDESTPEHTRHRHDMTYSFTYCLAIQPLLYYMSGSRDLYEIATSTALTAVFAACSGGLTGLSLDLHRDLLGTKSSSRIPTALSKSSRGTKCLTVMMISLLSIGSTLGFLYVRPHEPYATLSSSQAQHLYASPKPEQR